jgi:hypothetical protein
MLRIPRANAFRRNPLTVPSADVIFFFRERGTRDPSLVGMTVDGSLDLSNLSIKRLPPGMVVDGDLDLTDSKIQTLPRGLVVKGDLFLGGTPIQHIPDDVTVFESMDLRGSQVQTLGSNLKVGRHLLLSDTGVQSLGSNIHVEGNLRLEGSAVHTLGDDLHVEGDLDLSRSKVRSLGNRTKVDGSLNLENTPIQDLPAELKVIGDLRLKGSGVKVIRSGVKVDGNVTGFETYPTGQPRSVQSYGKATRAILKLDKEDAPRTAVEYKQRYPAEYQIIQKSIPNVDFRHQQVPLTDDLKQAIKKQHASPVSWIITYAPYYAITGQMYCKENFVIRVNIDVRQYERKHVETMRNLARDSKHPHEHGNLFTIGWVRICEDNQNKIWLVEEVQSDANRMRNDIKNRDEGVRPYLAEMLETMGPIIDRFYHDALGITFAEAAKKGYTVQMLNYPAKETFGSPRGVYTRIPAEMGMRLTSEPSLTVPEVGPVWSYKPNPRRRR